MQSYFLIISWKAFQKKVLYFIKIVEFVLKSRVRAFNIDPDRINNVLSTIDISTIRCHSDGGRS